jgi:hypothetical protein
VPALLLGGPLALVFHVPYGLGHGPTVVNEHGVVLGLTNDQWSYVGASWRALVLVGVLAVATVHTGRLARTATGLLTLGLVLSAAAAWVFPLYSLGALLEFAGLGCLAVAVLCERVLPRWCGIALALPVLAFLPVPLARDAVISAEWHVSGVLLQSTDVLATLVAAGWLALGLGVARVTRAGVRRPEPPDVPVQDAQPAQERRHGV